MGDFLNAGDDGGFVIFNFSSLREGCDESCIVEPGEHPLVNVKTYVVYRRGHVMTRVHIKALESLGCYSEQTPVTVDLLRRIQEGALASPYCVQGLQSRIRNSLEKT